MAPNIPPELIPSTNFVACFVHRYGTSLAMLAQCAFLCTAWNSAAAEPIDFVRDIRPILTAHCYACHGPQKQKSGLRFDVKSAAFQGGELDGESILPHQPDESPIWMRITTHDPDLRMPPQGDAVPPEQVATLRQWIQQGAVWPDGIDETVLTDPRDHWSFQPIATPSDASSIDSFIENKLADHGLQRSPPLDRMPWLRRVALDLHGLPPSPELVAWWEAHRSEDAYEQVVDQLLASPRFGERWAQHWLDVVRYADTHGFEVNTERPHAWHYRDYVINAMNRDTPYEQFVREQMVGDRLGQDTATGFLITASVLLPGQIGADEPSKRLARQDAIDEMVVNIGQSFLGLSIGCARCHDHKFDPISQRDYYAMQAFVAGVEYEDREVQTPEAIARRRQAEDLAAELSHIDRELESLEPLARIAHDEEIASSETSPSSETPSGKLRRGPVNAKRNSERIHPTRAKRLRFTIAATNNLEPCIDELEVFVTDGRNVALASAGAIVESSGDNIAPDRHELRFINDGAYGNSRSWMSNTLGEGVLTIHFPEVMTIERIVWGRDREGVYQDRLAIDYSIEVADEEEGWTRVAGSGDRVPYSADTPAPDAFTFSTFGLSADEVACAKHLQQRRKEVESRWNAVRESQQAFAGRFRTPDDIHVLHRGDPEQPKEPIGPGVPEFFGDLKLPRDADEADRRMALADWIASSENPFTARVMVNRIWQGHFGSGLVTTPNDFGRNGVPPSHPELLDWLAAEFIRSGWSMKQMHKRIVLSKTYRQSSAFEPQAAAVDADSRWLWRFPRRRLEAESIRDTMLAVSGQLNSKMFGRGFDLFDQRGGLSGFQPVESFSGEGLRRMIYAHKVRREREAVFGAFDCPDAGQSTPVRRMSTTPIQALNLFNSRFTLDQSSAFANRIQSMASQAVERQVEFAYQLALTRSPSSEEIADAAPVVREHGLDVLCRALFNSNEFLFLP
jgi:mono/diheme cytochrome c family protein